MDINKILQGLGIDFSNPEAKKGAAEAIQAILQSRQPVGGGGMPGTPPPGGQIDVEIDPDLIQPSQKHPVEQPDENIEIDQIKEEINKLKKEINQ